MLSDRRSPDGVAATPQHIRSGILAYAAGDALGVPWEGRTSDEVRWEALEALPARGDWPRGTTSDDTEQLLLVAEDLVEANGQINEQDFLARLAKALPRMRGAGPTTQAAVRRFLATGGLHAIEGSSVGAAMRALPFGWTTPVTEAAHRRELTIRLSRTTHGAPEAIISACVVAEMAAWALELHPVEAVVAAGLREAEDLARQYALWSGPRWVTLVCASQATSVACSFSNSSGVRQPRALWRRWRLWKISRYSKIALANSTRVFHRWRSSNSVCIRAQNDSITALS